MAKDTSGDVEKSVSTEREPEASQSRRLLKKIACIALIAILYVAVPPLFVDAFGRVSYRDLLGKVHASCSSRLSTLTGIGAEAELCPQMSSLFPSRSKALWTELSEDVYNTDEFRIKLAEELSGAVQHPYVLFFIRLSYILIFAP